MKNDVSYMACREVCKVCKVQGWPTVNATQRQKPVPVNNIRNTKILDVLVTVHREQSVKKEYQYDATV